MATRATVGGREIRLIEHCVFAELQRQPGIAMIDFTNAKSPFCGHVVSVYPLSLPGALTTNQSHVAADLARGVIDSAHA